MKIPCITTNKKSYRDKWKDMTSISNLKGDSFRLFPVYQFHTFMGGCFDANWWHLPFQISFLIFFRKYLLFNPLSLFHKLHIWEAYLMRLSHCTCHPVKCDGWKCWDFFLTLVPVTGILTAIEGFCTPALKLSCCERDEEFYRTMFGKKFIINKWDGIWNTYFEIKNLIEISAKFYCILFDSYIYKLGKARIMRKS